jgi:hypothetical protein
VRWLLGAFVAHGALERLRKLGRILVPIVDVPGERAGEKRAETSRQRRVALVHRDGASRTEVAQ